MPLLYQTIQQKITVSYTTELNQGQEIKIYGTPYNIKGIDRTNTYNKNGSTYGILVLNVETV